MRDVGTIRARTVEILASMLLRPGMFGSGQCFEMAVRAQLADLAYMDERESNLEQALQELERVGLWGPLGAWGVFAALFGPGDHTDDLAALYARVASQLGYFQPHRYLDNQAWAEIETAADWASDARRTRADVEARFGPPSYRGAGQEPKTFGYARSFVDAWMTFHFDDSAKGELAWVHVHEAGSERRFIDVRPAPPVVQGPEDAYRAFLIATLSGSEREVRKHTFFHRDPSLLWTAGYPADVARLLADQFRTMSIVRVSKPDNVVYLISDACPVPLAVINTDGGWLVDPEQLLHLRGDARTLD